MKIFSYLTEGSERSILVKKNVLYSFILQGISILCSFMLVPLTLDYLSAEEYGVWLTLNSILTWFNVCEIGIGMGLKNKLAESLAHKDFKTGKMYVSITYIMLAIIMMLFIFLFLVFNRFVDWCKILNIYSISSNSLALVVVVVVSFFCINFVVKTIGIILAADQRVAYSSIMGVISSLISLFIIWVMTKVTSPSLLNVAIVFSSTPVIVLIIGSIFLFKYRYTEIKPSLKLFDISKAKELIGLSLNFFILQVSGIIVFTTSNIIITQTVGPQEVAVYNICFKYFNIITLAFNLILGPMWPAYTNAYVLGDMAWIKRALTKSFYIWILLSVVALIMLLSSSLIFKLWIGDALKIPFVLSLLMFFYVIIGNWNNIYAQMLAGVGKIKLSIFNSIFNAIIFIPLGVCLSKNLGVKGVTIAITLTILTSTFWQPIQCYKIINNKAKGIWNK